VSKPIGDGQPLDELRARAGQLSDGDWLSLVWADQRRRWQGGDRILVEAYLEQKPLLRSHPEKILDLIFNEVALREERGETPQLEEYLSRFPDYADQLQRQFALHQALMSRAPRQDQEKTLKAEDGRTAQIAETIAAKSSSATEADIGLESLGFGRYEILAELGRGGMGVVYKARQKQLNRLVALKMILAGAHAGRDDLTRFRREAEAIAQIQHPNLVQIYEVDEQEGRPFFSLEFLEGGSLDQRIQGKPQPPAEAAQLVEILARAVHAVHQHGIIHRDLKPANVLLTADGIPKIGDFGLAKKLGQRGQTMAGDIVGTPSYMSPEQAAGKVAEIGPHTDVYALGTILYEMLTGRPPFLAQTSLDTVNQVMVQEPVPPRRLQPRVPRDLDTICLKCLHKEPRHRYATALELADDLRRFQASEPIKARPTGMVRRLVKWSRRHPARATLMGVSLAAIVALLSIGAVYHARLQIALDDAEAKGEESYRRLIRLQVSNGSRLADDSDWFSALVWYTQAMSLEKDAAEEDMHRIRVGAYFRRCPRLAQLFYYPHGVGCVSFSPDGRYLLIVGRDAGAWLCETATGQRIGPVLHEDRAVTAAAFDGNSKRWSTAVAGEVRIWDAETGKALSPVLEHKGQVSRLGFSPDGRLLLAACEERHAVLWDASSGRRLPVGQTFQPDQANDTGISRPPAATPPLTHAGAVTDARFNSDGNAIVTASKDHTARLWHTADGRPLTSPLLHPAAVTQASFSPDGRVVATVAADRKVRLWNAATGKERVAPLEHRGTVNQASFSPDSQWLVTASEDGTARIWSVATGQPRGFAIRHASEINKTGFSHDGLRVVTAGDDNAARIWDTSTGELLPPLLRHHGTVECASFSPDGKWLVTASKDQLVRLWLVVPERLRPVSQTPATADAAGQDWRQNVAVLPDGVRKLRFPARNVVQVCDANTGEPIGPPLKHSSDILYVAFSPDGYKLVSASDDNTARVWDPLTGELVAPPLTHLSSVNWAAFSPDGRMIVTASSDQTARVWDVRTGDPLSPPLAHPCTVRQAAFAPDSLQVITTGADNIQRRWDLRPDDRPTAELVRLAQVLAGSRIAPRRGFLPLGAENIWGEWLELRRER
jgi:WD40 repeat protein/tRNA A-37 threonylcarbamoyl transferase component Bud32